MKDGWTLSLLKSIEWHRFEHLVAAYECERGYDAKLTAFGPDGGVDVHVCEKGSDRLIRVIQCKAYDREQIGVQLIREFYGVMTHLQVPEGAFFTTSDFTPDALAFAAGKPIDLVTGPQFLDRIAGLPLSSNLKLFRTATEGDYTTPTCPSCGVKMLLRTAMKGRSEGDTFYGCRHYPRCKQTLRVPRAS